MCGIYSLKPKIIYESKVFDEKDGYGSNMCGIYLSNAKDLS